ncbi:MAG: hypothetical protein E6K54_06865 [Gammaproteobacteria bacterium]|nr:MAG: hypothetical protein E6K54_06865 [Gammaproteobacteria bacterium]
MLKKSTSTLLLASTVLAITQNVQAEMPGFYAGAQLGYDNTHINTTDLVTVNNGNSPVLLPGLNNMLLTYRLSFGYQFDQHWAIEFGYRHFNNASSSAVGNNYIASASSKVSAFDLTAKGILPVNSKLNLYAKLGLAYLRPNSQGGLIVIAPYNGSINSYSKTLEPTFGVGISYALKPNVPVEFSWNRIQKIGGSNHAPSSDFYSLGVSYYFG